VPLLVVRAPFTARVVQVVPSADDGFAIRLEQVATRARPVPEGGCTAFYPAIVNPRVQVREAPWGEGKVLGFSRGGASFSASCRLPATSAENQPKPAIRLVDAPHPVVKGPGRYTSGYGFRTDPFDRRTAFHEGVDLAAYFGKPIHTPGDGVVAYTGVKGDYGKVVELELAGGFMLRFAQLNSIDVNTGDRVKAGDVIATMGSTGRSAGPHLHLEVYLNGKSYDPETIQGLTLIGPG
jgi:murein DD-endopeptidase MepM/ murein hydrolase activator NlpD